MIDAKLRVVGGPFFGQTIQLPRGKLLIGRAEDCDVRPNSEFVSGYHCVLLLDDFTLRIRDLGSKNGTIVNGHRVGTSAVILLQDDLIAAREELRFRATHDVLTGVSNRAAVMDALRGELSRQVREQRSFGVILVDIDHFKNVNDTFGHLCGDEVLRWVTRRMKECVRPYDTLGRYGGEEFLIIASDVDGDGALALAERIRSIVESKPVMTQAGEVSVTVSLGAAVSTSTRNADPQMLLRLADQALYRAKDNGRNRCELAAVPGSTALATATAGGIPLKPGPS